MQASGLQPVVEFGTNPGSSEPPGDASGFVDAGLFEDEDVLHGDLFAFHADALGERTEAAAAVAEAGNLDKHVDGGADLLPDGPHTHVRVRHTHHNL